MKRALLLMVAILSSCVVQTEGLEPGEADSLDGLDASRFMRADVDTGTVGSLFAHGGAFFTGEQAELDSATVSIRQMSPTFAGGAAIVNIDAESDTGPWLFLRARNIDTLSDGLSQTATDKFLLANDGSIMTWGRIGVGTSVLDAPVHVNTDAPGPSAIFDSSTSKSGFVAFKQSGSTVGVIGSAGAIEGNNSNDFGVFAETDGGVKFYTNGKGKAAVTISKTGAVGIGTSTPTASLDIAGTARLTRYSVPPVDCDASQDGTISMTSKYTLCICNGTDWVNSANGAPPCNW